MSKRPRLAAMSRAQEARKRIFGGVPERPKGSDCKSDGSAFGGSNPPPSTIKSGGALVALGGASGYGVTQLSTREFISRYRAGVVQW